MLTNHPSPFARFNTPTRVAETGYGTKPLAGQGGIFGFHAGKKDCAGTTERLNWPHSFNSFSLISCRLYADVGTMCLGGPKSLEQMDALRIVLAAGFATGIIHLFMQKFVPNSDLCHIRVL